MKWTVRYGAAALLFGMSAASQAGLLGGLFSTHGKSCGSQPCCEDPCCEDPCCEEACPVVARPCEQTYTYQRKCSDLRPPCCDDPCCEDPCCEDPCCEEVGCDPACDAGCTDGCGNGLCGKKKGCGLLKNLFGHKKKLRGCLSGDACCEEGCAGACDDGADPCEIATLIYTAQTACYADDRAEAVDELGEFDCRCHPEVMVTLVYSLNDTDEEVRAEAADSIGDMLDDGRCCCSPEVVAALTHALGDCDADVRGEAEDALEVCGYEVVEGCCKKAGCDDACGDVGGRVSPTPATPAQPAPVPARPAPATPAPAAEVAPEAAPAPPADPEAYVPPQANRQAGRDRSLANLFGLNK